MEDALDHVLERHGPIDASDEDEILDEAAQGHNLNIGDLDDSDESEPESEIDAAGAAAGLVSRDDKPFRGVEEFDRRDQRRWELDPKSRDEPDGM